MSKQLAKDPSGIRYLIPWVISLLPGHSPLDDEIPWLTFKSITWLKSNVTDNMNVFEYGSGGSTLFLAQRCHKLVSVEHDNEFYKIVKQRLDQKKITNVEYHLTLPEKINSQKTTTYSPQSYSSFAQKYKQMDFEKYVRIIDNYPDNFFDLVLIDGRSRASCVSQSLNKIRNGGYLVLDNSERHGYKNARKLLDHFQHTDYFGIVPWNLDLYQSTIWKIEKS